MKYNIHYKKSPKKLWVYWQIFAAMQTLRIALELNTFGGFQGKQREQKHLKSTEGTKGLGGINIHGAARL